MVTAGMEVVAQAAETVAAVLVGEMGVAMAAEMVAAAREE